MGSLSSWLSKKLFFDQKDYELLGIVNDVLSREDFSGLKHLLAPYQHPRGIKEMAASKGLRTAYAAANLLGSLEIGKSHDRINALRALHDEAMAASIGHLRLNTARVLMQIMKDLVRSSGDRRRQLELAHDFRVAATGKTSVVDAMLERYYLVRMPEDVVQLSFDHHVHDANTKGRKSATHLIMDAWIKGIRHLTVIYYNFVKPEVVEELLDAAEIVGITVRVGVEFMTRYRSKQVKLIWVPKGFTSSLELLEFLRSEPMTSFLQEGQRLTALQLVQLNSLLRQFNVTFLPELNANFGIEAKPLDVQAFEQFVGIRQPSVFLLAQFIHLQLFPYLLQRFEQITKQYPSASQEERLRLEAVVAQMNAFDLEEIEEEYLLELATSKGCAVNVVEGVGTAVCPVQTPLELIDLISELRVGSRFILNLWGLDVDEAFEILYDCKGKITHLEIVNLRNFLRGEALDNAEMASLCQAINATSVADLKHFLLKRLAVHEARNEAKNADMVAKMSLMLKDIYVLYKAYQGRALRLTLGSDSTGQSCHGFGMGLVVKQSLPRFSQKALVDRNIHLKGAMVVGIELAPRVLYRSRHSTNRLLDRLYEFARQYPLLRFIGYKGRRDFHFEGYHPVPYGQSNIYTLGGNKKECGNHFELNPREKSGKAKISNWPYLNHGVRNLLKVLCGLMPAMATFYLAKDWWLLKYGGAFIWFGITGLRNIIQSVLGGGGISRTPLLKWRDYMSWSRFSDSLLYTGFSVPLLDYVVKTLLLGEYMGITVGSNALALYATMGLVNGLYICTHNLIRGLPKQAAFWNLFRSVLSFPLAMAISAGLGGLLGAAGVAAVADILQQWAAIISKVASDCVAAVIEGIADRGKNMGQRLTDYQAKIDQILSVNERLELVFPTEDVARLLADPKTFVHVLLEKRPDLANAIIINALDLLYFWMYQPLGRSSFRRLLRESTPQTRQIVLSSLLVLKRKREISELFLDGLLGKDFSKGLAFYLDYSEEYLQAIGKLQERLAAQQG